MASEQFDTFGRTMISLGDIYDKDVNFLFGAGASFGLLPTLSLGIKKAPGGPSWTLEELATHFAGADLWRISLFMHYYCACIRPAETLDISAAKSTDPGRTVIENYRRFLETVLAMLQRRRALERRCNIFTTNYDGCFALVADEIIRKGHIDFVLNDGTRGFTSRVLQARNFNTYLCQAGVFGRHQTSVPQINLIHLHGSVYWSKTETGMIQVDYSHESKAPLLDESAKTRLRGFSQVLESSRAMLSDLVPPPFLPAELTQFWALYEQKPIVNPTKWKFHETVYEEHYYQMLRLLSYELEKPNSVLITFGFSFADEHILNLVLRSLSNPGLQVFVCCFSSADQASLSEKFKGYRNVQCLSLPDGALMDFTAFNDKVLTWPTAANKLITHDPDASVNASTQSAMQVAGVDKEME
jgi:hypothetical protein